MKIATGLILALLTAAPAMAQAPTPAPATAPAASYSADTPIVTLLADPAAKAVLDKVFPTLSTHPALDQFKGMSLRQVQPMSQGAMTDEAVAKADAELKALAAPAKP